MDRQRLSRDLAKAIAYVQCGRPIEAMEHVACLLSAFREAGVDVEYAFRLSESLASPERASDWIADRTASAVLFSGGREGSVQL